MRVILINAKLQTVEEMEIGRGLEQLQMLIGGYVEIGHYFEKGDVCFVDEEGLLKQMEHFFQIRGAHQPFAGHGLIVGTTRKGASTNAKLCITAARELVTFHSALEIRSNYA
jgi:hypothetical protein